MTTTLYRNSADASSTYRERTGVQIARSTSSAETGNLAAVTRDSTFQVGGYGADVMADLPRSQSAALPR